MPRAFPADADDASSLLGTVSSRLSSDRKLDKLAAERHRLRVLNGRWRDVAFGRDADAQLARIFDLDELPHAEVRKAWRMHRLECGQ